MNQDDLPVLSLCLRYIKGYIRGSVCFPTPGVRILWSVPKGDMAKFREYSGVSNVASIICVTYVRVVCCVACVVCCVLCITMHVEFSMRGREKPRVLNICVVLPLAKHSLFYLSLSVSLCVSLFLLLSLSFSFGVEE